MSIATGTLFIVAAPSGAGKTSLVDALVSATPQLHVSVSYTTRPPRPNEVSGEDYHFVDEATFQRMRHDNEFLESAEVFGHHYGTSKTWVQAQLMDGIDVILEIDWQGAAIVRSQIQHCVSIFILPPSKDILEQRLRGRGQDNESVIAKRMQAAQSEMAHYDEFDFLVVNDNFEQAKQELQTIVLSQRLCLRVQKQKQQALLKTLL